MRKCILNPFHFFSLYGYHIISHSCIFSQLMYTPVIIRNLAYLSLLFIVNRLCSIPVTFASSVFYLHKHKISFMISDNIHLSLSVPVISFFYYHSPGLQVFSCALFPDSSCLSLIRFDILSYSFFFSLSIESTNIRISATTS